MTDFSSPRARTWRVLGAFLFGASALGASAPGAGDVWAQPRPFSRIEVSAEPVMHLNRTHFHRSWRPAPGAALEGATPFYRGWVDLGLAYHRFAAQPGVEVPPFYAVAARVGWSGRRAAFRRFGLEGGFGLGNYRMTFDVDDFAGVRNESELFGDLTGGLRLRLTRRWHLAARGRYTLVFTARRLHLVDVGAGLAYQFATPRFLRRVLR